MKKKGISIGRPLQLVIIRHAESARNKAKRGTTYFADEEARKTIKGVPDQDIPLTEEGREQARKTGIYLRDRLGVPDSIFHSGYVRTIETMEGALSAFTAAERKDIKIRMSSFIRERDAGYTYEMTEAEAQTHFPWLKEYWKTFGGFMARPPGGESLCDVAQRVRMFYEALKDHRRGDKVWIFTHGGTIRSFRFILERWPYEKALAWPPGQSPENCSITIYDYDKKTDRLKLAEYNTVCWK